MNLIAMLIATVVTLPAAGLVAWACLAMTQDEEDFCTSSGFQRMHFDL